MIVTDPAVRDGLIRDPYIRKTLTIDRRVNIMLVGIGATKEDLGQYRTGYLDDADLEYIRERGVVGEVIGTYFSQEGDVVPLGLNERIIGLGFKDLANIPIRVGVSWGVQKAFANTSAARSGLINVLITDEHTAGKMVDILNGERSAVAPASNEPSSSRNRHYESRKIRTESS